MLGLMQNPLNTFFHDFLISRRVEILAAFAHKPIRECREKSFWELLSWIPLTGDYGDDQTVIKL